MDNRWIKGKRLEKHQQKQEKNHQSFDNEVVRKAHWRITMNKFLYINTDRGAFICPVDIEQQV